MKITDVRTFIVLGNSLFVRVFTDENVDGVGECSPMNCEVTAYFIEKTLKPLLLGKNPLEIEKLWNLMFFRSYKQGVQGIQPEAIAGIDIALWDILGRVTGKPIYLLLGGAYQTTFQLYASIGGGGGMKVDSMVKNVERFIQKGFKAFKIRMDWGVSKRDANPDKDLDMYKAVASILDKDMMLSFDANNGYSVKVAIQQAEKFADIGIFHFEEPVAQYNYLGLKQVCDASSIPISAGEHEYTKWQFKDLIMNAGVDIIQPDVVKCAGLTEMQKIMTLAEVHDKLLLPHQTQPTVGTIASLHACSTIHGGILPHEFTGRRQYLEELFIDFPIIEDGQIALLNSPGLGLSPVDEYFKEIEYHPR